MNDKEIIDRITMVCQSDASVKLGYDDTAWTDKEKLVQIMRILGKTTQTDKEKIMQEALKAIDDLIKHYERMKTAIKFWHEKDTGFMGRKPISVSNESLV